MAHSKLISLFFQFNGAGFVAYAAITSASVWLLLYGFLSYLIGMVMAVKIIKLAIEDFRNYER